MPRHSAPRAGSGARRTVLVDRDRARHAAGPAGPRPGRRRARRDRSRYGALPARRPHPGHGLGRSQGRPARAREGRRRAGRRVEASGHRRHAVPHRLDDQGLHRAVDPEAARRRQARPRRAGRDLRARAARLAHAHRGLAEDPRARAPHPHRRLRHRRSVGRPADAAARGRLHAPAEGRRALHPADRHGDGVLEPRLRPARPDRRQRLAAALQGLRPAHAADAARDDRHRLRRRGRRRPNAAPSAIAGKTTPGSSSRRWRTAPSARWAASRPARPTTPSGWRICCRRGRRATAPTAVRCGGRACASWRRALQLRVGAAAARRQRRRGVPRSRRLRHGNDRGGGLRPRAHAEPRRRLPRLRLARAAAARLRRRHLRPRQSHLRRSARPGLGRGGRPAPGRCAHATSRHGGAGAGDGVRHRRPDVRGRHRSPVRATGWR